MRKLLSIALIAAVSVTFTVGCSKKTVQQTAASFPVALKDGTYSVQGKADEKGWIPHITVIVTGGKITEAIYDETAAMRKSENIEYQRSFKKQKNVDLLAIYKTLQTGLAANQDASKVDSIAGATNACNSFKALALEALKDAKAENKYKDGEYTATGIEDDKSWTPTITITVKGSKIQVVKYDEISSKIYKNKSQDKAYQANLKEQKKVNLLAVYDALQKSLIEKQDPAKIDTYTGATMSSVHFTELAKQAIEKGR